MRPVCVIPFFLLALWALLALGNAAHAQEEQSTEDNPQTVASDTDNSESSGSAPAKLPTAKSPAAKPWESPAHGGTAGPDIYLLPDKGKLRQVLGFSYQEFQRAWQQQNKERVAAPPTYTIASVEAAGTADENHVKLDIEMEVTPKNSEWVSVPLQLPEFIIQSWSLDNQTEEECLVFDTKKRSYVLWLKSKAQEPRKILLTGLQKLNRQLDRSVLEIQLPHSANTQFSLLVPRTDVVFETSPGIEITTQNSDEANTEVQLTGQLSPLRLQWGPPQENKVATSAVVKAEGDINAHVDRYRVYYDAAFTIESYDDPLQVMHIQLPPGVTVTKDTLPSNYRINNHDEQTGLLELQLLEKPANPWKLKLKAEKLRDEDEATFEESLCTVSGFDILEAIRQSGTVRISMDDQLQAFYDLHQDIEQVPVSSDNLVPATQTVVAQFKYSRVPWTLDIHTVARRQRVSVDPQYKLRIFQNQAELHLNLNYQFAGAYTPAVRIRKHGWEIANNQYDLGGAVNYNLIKSDNQKMLILPINNPKAERVPISLVLRRDIKLGQLELPLPEPIHAFVLPGHLTVEADPSLRVTRSTEGSRGISVASATNQQYQGNGNSQESQQKDNGNLELSTFLSNAVLGIDVAKREREISVGVETQVEMAVEEIQVLQKFHYQVNYQPISQLELEIPSKLWDSDSLQVRLDGVELPIGLGIFSEALPAKSQSSQSVQAEPSTSTASSSTPNDIRQLIASLPRPMQGEFLLEIEYQQKSPTLADEALSPISLPLVSTQNKPLSNSVVVSTKDKIRATLNQPADRGLWSIVLSEQAADTNELKLISEEKSHALPFLMQIDSESDNELVALDMAWLQTWIVGNTQQDRAVFRFQTSQESVLAQLPTNLPPEDIEVLLDGVRVLADSSQLNHLKIAIPQTIDSQNHTLEFRYQRPVALESWEELTINMPQLVSRKSSAYVFWQLILPPDWHVANSPAALSAQYRLGWHNYQWGRHPAYSQQDLERLANASTAPVPASPNQYVFRGFDWPRQVSVTVLRRTWLGLTATSLAFGIGMLVLYTTIIQYRSFWLTLAISLSAVVVYAPEIATFIVQAVFWGGVLVVFAAILRQILTGTPQRFIVLDSSLESESTAVTAAWEPEADSQVVVETTPAPSVKSGGLIS